MRSTYSLALLFSVATVSAQVVVPTTPKAVIAPQPLALGSLLNTFVSQYAYEHIEWQKDIQIEGAKDRALLVVSQQPGRYMGESAYFGFYTYSAKRFSELTKGQQREVLNSPQLSAWLQWFGNPVRVVSEIPRVPAPQMEPAKPAEQLAPDFGKFSYTIKPDEMLNRQPLQLKLRD